MDKCTPDKKVSIGMKSFTANNVAEIGGGVKYLYLTL